MLVCIGVVDVDALATGVVDQAAPRGVRGDAEDVVVVLDIQRLSRLLQRDREVNAVRGIRRHNMAAAGRRGASVAMATTTSEQQPTATLFACLSHFRGRSICHRLPVATARLHRCSIPLGGVEDREHGDWSANDWGFEQEDPRARQRKRTNNESIVPTAQASAGALVRWACRSDHTTRVGRVTLQRMDNVGIVVESLDAAISFFSDLVLELEGRATVEGDWAERVTGLRDMRVEIAMMRTPDGHSRLEISRFLTPPVVADHRNAPVNALGYLRVMFAVADIDDTLARLRPHGAELVGELAQYEDKYRLCYVRGPEGLLIGLAEQIG